MVISSFVQQDGDEVAALCQERQTPRGARRWRVELGISGVLLRCSANIRAAISRGIARAGDRIAWRRMDSLLKAASLASHSSISLSFSIIESCISARACELRGGNGIEGSKFLAHCVSESACGACLTDRIRVIWDGFVYSFRGSNDIVFEAPTIIEEYELMAETKQRRCRARYQPPYPCCFRLKILRTCQFSTATSV